ncbi:MAG: glycosyltransferase family 39 protein [Planctomycetes bacterium]|nr:glycosyltransferase family 39 protein [Planctomycetota bacterium]
MTPRTRSAARIAACAAVLLLALALRVYRLSERGIFLFDEGFVLCEARWYAGALRALPDAFRYAWRVHARSEDAAGEVAGLHARMEAAVAAGRYPLDAKNTHNFLIGLGNLVFGDGDGIGNAEGVLFGLLTVALVLHLGQALYGPAGGLVSALVLAVCPLHVLLSRGSLAEADMIFFFVAAVALLRLAVTGGRRPLATLFLAGLATGLAFTSNKRLVVAAPAVWSLFGVLLLAPDRPLAGLRFRGLVWLSVGMALPLLGWEAVHRLGAWALAPQPYAEPESYFERLLQASSQLGVPASGLGDPDALFFFLREYTGWPVLLLVAAGVLREAVGRRSEGLYLVLPLLWVVGFFQFRTREQAIRYLGPALPFLALAAGAALRGGSEPSRVPALVRRSLPWATAAAVLAAAALGTHEWTLDRSGMGQAFRYLRERRAAGEQVAYFCADPPIAWTYDPPPIFCDPIPETRKGLRRRYREGVRYLVVTPGLLALYPSPRYLAPLLARMAGVCPPVTFEHPAGRLPYLAYEHHLFGDVQSLADTRAIADYLAKEGGVVQVYDLSGYFR